jgi:hypothetical protein
MKYMILIFRAERALLFITTRAKQIHIGIMTTSQSIRNKVRSGRAVRSEPQDLTLINENLEIKAYFEQVECMRFCENIKGYNVKLAE